MNVELKKRVFTGVIGGAALLSVILFGGSIGIFLFATALSLGTLFEFSEITFSMNDRVEKKYMLLCLGWFVGLVNFLIPQIEHHLLVVCFLMLFSYFLFSAKKHEEANFSLHFKELMFSVFAILYLGFIPLYFLRIYESPYGPQWTVLFLLVVWSVDSGAYFAGKKYGKEKLYPQISPKKTREGAIGGLVLGAVVAIIFKALFLPVLSWVGVVFLPIAVGVTAQVGDLCESFFKRAFDKKDSGKILPGHGGFLDRFDGVVFSLPVMYACLRFFS